MSERRRNLRISGWMKLQIADCKLQILDCRLQVLHLRQSVRGVLEVFLFAALIGSSLSQSNAQSSGGSSFDAVIAQSQPRMVKVFGAKAGNVEGNATGILVSAEGHLLTMQGVYLDGQSIRVILADGSEHSASVLRRNREAQLALLKINAATPKFFELSQTPVGEQGDWVIALTNAFRVADKDEPVSAMLGIISLRTWMEARLTRRDVAYQGELVVVDCITSNPGAGGGAIILPNGQLVGMVGRIIDSSETNTRLNYAVPNSKLWEFVHGESSDGKTEPMETSEKADLGIVIFRLGGKNNPAYIESVKRGAAAAGAALQPDDMIVSIGGQKVGNVKQYDEVLDTLRPNEEVILVIKRGKEFLRIPLTPDVRK